MSWAESVLSHSVTHQSPGGSSTTADPFSAAHWDHEPSRGAPVSDPA